MIVPRQCKLSGYFLGKNPAKTILIGVILLPLITQRAQI